MIENGAFFDVLVERISAAQKSVHFETFLWKHGELAQRIADALSERARAGVTVRVLGTAFKLGNGGLREGAALELAGARDAVRAA